MIKKDFNNLKVGDKIQQATKKYVLINDNSRVIDSNTTLTITSIKRLDNEYIAINANDVCNETMFLSCPGDESQHMEFKARQIKLIEKKHTDMYLYLGTFNGNWTCNSDLSIEGNPQELIYKDGATLQDIFNLVAGVPGAIGSAHLYGNSEKHVIDHATVINSNNIDITVMGYVLINNNKVNFFIN